MNDLETETLPLTLSDSAVGQLKRIREEQQIPEDLGLRVGVKGGGCSGFSYVLGFDQGQEDDMRFSTQGLEILMNKAHALYLIGIQIDWVDGLNNRGFTFTNPNAKSTCGCGTSFSA
ncbi:MAG TPA: iron-sulfur cluster assembly accessory protein [Saprospiraceae bacterium]|nr:iron-sulfur cluster assembly accessory protein [Saprospiraceae bacterium]HNT19336.1 iron-sulfur cluster assembly accessory protein [Saprospiraceae bacterium]